MNTVLFLDHTAKWGGGEIALLNLIGALDQTRFQPVVVLATEGRLAERLRLAGVETHILPLGQAVLEARKDSLGLRSLLQIRSIGAVAAYAVRLARWARARQADLIHTNSLKSDIYGGVAGRLAGIPVIWHVRDHVNGDYLPPIVAAAFRALSQWIPTRVVANSESTLRQLWPAGRRRGAVVPSGVVEVIHDGTLPGSSWGKLADGDRRPIVTLVGRIAEWKGQHIFLRAAAAVLARFPQTCFRIVGAPLFGEEKYDRSLRALSSALGISGSVEFLGFRDDIPELLKQTDIVVHASILGEPFGQVVIEGMAAGKPVVATDGGALPEIIESGVSGLLVPMGEADSMAEAIAALLSDPAAARAMGEAGRRRVEEQFTILHTARKIEAVYDQLLKERDAGRRPAQVRSAG